MAAHAGSVAYVLGAGVEKPLGMPLADELLREVETFASGTGKPIASAIKVHLPHLMFSFEKYTGEQGEIFGERVLSQDAQSLSKAKQILEKHLGKNQAEESQRIVAVKTVIEALEAIRDKNQLKDETLEHLASLAGEQFQSSGGDHIINPRGVQLTPMVRQAFRKTFQGIIQAEDVGEEERETLRDIVRSMMNFEELLSDLFTGFYTKRAPDQKKYLYVSWLLWAFLRLTMEEKCQNGPSGLYAELANLGSQDHVVTFNYTTKFLPPTLNSRVSHFHGNCLSYLRWDTQEMFGDDDKVAQATSVDRMAEFIGGLDMDVGKGRIFLPGIVPPLAVKPVLCREFLSAWYRAGEVIDAASAIVVVGYSFNTVDRHFNDLIRKRAGHANARLVVINPDIDTTGKNVCSLLGKAPDTLTEITRNGFEARQGGSLLLVKARSEELTMAKLRQLVR